MNRSLRLFLTVIENSLTEMVNNGAASDYPEIVEVIKLVHSFRINSKIGAIKAFDELDKARQFLVAVDNGEKISVWGHSGDEFDLELAFGIINKVKNIYDKERLYCLFLKVMDGDYDD